MRCYGDDTQITNVLRYGARTIPFLITVVGPRTVFPCDISVLWTAVGIEETLGMGSCIVPTFFGKASGMRNAKCFRNS